ncbi:RHS repeat domain-containing protein [Thalassoglobus polymorphus]|uniref:tRNA nuclease WapA n=1 Tax=Thalassoglobus polymorphus TaxID=2527994 RepID=A0A517QIN8_9PLAN|nr:RHS repeat-associated core domain-containing protein [Thalassoglobus polymorphus]QDT31466.1 tRNA nuclease WapA precursor [Thalassoglobus polymorphus]
MGRSKKRIQYQYDAVGNRSLMIDPDGGRFSYSYDSLNRIKIVENPQAERTTFSYDADSRRALKILANGTRASFTYDAASNITTLANLKSDSSVISKFDYQYDKAGNRTVSLEADGSRVTWSYDAKNQITEDYRTGTVPYRNTFMYDPAGNRLLKNESGARTTYSYDAANQLSNSVDANGTTTYTFDADGNQQLVQAPDNDRTTTTWDYENKTTLVELPSGIRNTMSYEPDGLRVKLEESTGTKKFIWDDQNYLAESDENDDINVVYTNEPNYYGNLVSQYRKSGVVWTPGFYHYEALGSTRQLTDNAETITDTYLYDAWGNVINSSGSTENPFQFTGNVGYYSDVDTENQYIRARIYSPTIGRWCSIDPLGFVGGVNVYLAYFIPRFIDPSGTQLDHDGGYLHPDGSVRPYPPGASPGEGGPQGGVPFGPSLPGAPIPGGLGPYMPRPEPWPPTDQTIFDRWCNSQKRRGDWWTILPRCPSNLCFCPSTMDTLDGVIVFDPNDEWTYPTRIGFHESRFHPGAVYSMRSKAINGHSNQCVYDGKGQLIRTTPGHGTVDSSALGLDSQVCRMYQLMLIQSS